MKYCETCRSSWPDDFTLCPRDGVALRAAADLPAGLVLRGKYEILERIGTGGMATVYRARHLAFGEVRALKVVSGRLSDEDDFLRRFRQEAVVARRLQHPNAVRVDDLDTTDDGRPFIVMEYVEGENLRDVIRREGPLAVGRAVAIARQVVSALAAAHALGITHRDIKPDNILLTRGPDGAETAKVLDFGIAKVKEGALAGSGYAPTQTGTMIGTPQYISPEQAMGRRGEEVDGRADLYSLAIVVYEMATGQLPFQSDTAVGVILQHLQSAPTPPHQLRPELGLPPALSELLLKAMEKDRERRFGSAEEMLLALDRLAVSLPGGEAAPAGVATPLPPLPTPRPAPTVRGDIEQLPTRALPTPTPRPAPSDIEMLATRAMPTPTPVPSRRGRWRRWRLAPIAAIVVATFVVFGRDRPGRRHQPDTAAGNGGLADPEAARGDADERIQDEVEAVLGRARATRDADIDVDVTGGIAFLEGQVEEQVTSDVAEALAQAVPGVRGVRNMIEVQESERRADRRPDEPGEHAPPGKHVPAPPVPPAAGRRGAPTAPALDSPEGRAVRELLETGRRERAAGNPMDAVAAYKGVLAIDPLNSEAHAGLGEAIGEIAGRSVERFLGRRPTPPPATPRP